MKTLEYLDRAKAAKGLKTDYALAKALHKTPSTVLGYRAGRSAPDDEVATALAEMIGINPLEVIAAAHMDRARTAEMKMIWGGLLEKISKGFDVLLPEASPHGDLVFV